MPASLFAKLTTKQLEAMMSPKQKQFVANLRAEGATFDIVAVKGRPWLQNIVRKPRRSYKGYWIDGDCDYDGLRDDMDFADAMGGSPWGD
jgi:hypothetical protein